MKPREPAARKAVRKKQEPRPPRRLFTVRSALVLQLALLTALGGAGLLLAGHRTIAQTALGSVAILGAALKLFDSLIELCGSLGWRGRAAE
jgi:hypothetical protein